LIKANLSPGNNVLERLDPLFWAAMDWLYPPHCCNCGRRGSVICEKCYELIELIPQNQCAKCGYPIRGKADICSDCRNSPPIFYQMKAWAVYTGPIAKAIHSFKYKNDLYMGKLLANPLCEIFYQSGWEIDLIVPVPLSTQRMRTRGYNQSALLASYLGRKIGIPVSNNLLKRIRHTETQISLDVNKRFTNLMDAFYANPAKLKKKNVLVIDDVITTGATMHNCTKAILNAGADNVYCLSAARTILKHPKLNKK